MITPKQNPLIIAISFLARLLLGVLIVGVLLAFVAVAIFSVIAFSPPSFFLILAILLLFSLLEAICKGVKKIFF